MNVRRVRRSDTANVPAENENPSSAISSTVEGSDIASGSSISGACYPRSPSAPYKKESFVPFDGTIDDFKKTLGFQQLVKRYGFVLVERDAIHCGNPAFGRNDNNEKSCKKGVIVSTFGW